MVSNRLNIRFPKGVPIDGLPWTLGYLLGRRVYSGEMAMVSGEIQFIQIERRVFSSLFMSELGRSRSQLKTFLASLEARGIGYFDAKSIYFKHWQKGVQYFSLPQETGVWLIENFSTLNLTKWELKNLPNLLAYLHYRGLSHGNFVASPSSIVEDLGYARNGGKILELKNLIQKLSTTFEINYTIFKSSRDHGEAISISHVDLSSIRASADEELDLKALGRDLFLIGVRGLREKYGDKVFLSPPFQSFLEETKRKLEKE